MNIIQPFKKEENPVKLNTDYISNFSLLRIQEDMKLMSSRVLHLEMLVHQLSEKIDESSIQRAQDEVFKNIQKFEPKPVPQIPVEPKESEILPKKYYNKSPKKAVEKKPQEIPLPQTAQIPSNYAHAYKIPMQKYYPQEEFEEFPIIPMPGNIQVEPKKVASKTKRKMPKKFQAEEALSLKKPIIPHLGVGKGVFPDYPIYKR